MTATGTRPRNADQGWSPYTGAPVGDPVPHTPAAEVDRACRAAAAAAPALGGWPLRRRAELLRAVAAAIESRREDVVALADAESGLGPARLGGELTRTRQQLEMFADVVEEGSIVEAIVDLPDPAALPAPRPDLRRMLVPLGPVAVYSASNFPLAFSVAGGDTASALAAGCPVVVKAHSAHPGLSVLCAGLVRTALAAAGAPAGTFGMVHGTDAGRALIVHPAITAGGFTGSLAAGRALFDLAAGRPAPIPFYGELGSLNPTVVTPGAVAARSGAIVSGFVGSYTLGAGQFCTKPGLLFLPAGHGLDGALADALAAASVGPLLNARIRAAYQETLADLAGTPGVAAIVPAEDGAAAGTGMADGSAGGYQVAPALLRVTAADFVARADRLLEECFGPAALVIEYGSTEELTAALDVVPGSLVGTLHAEPDTEAELARALLDRLSRLAGRVVFDGWPTGVAVTWAQHHGGPWPATTSALHTSVGVTAIRRFLRPVAYQNLPDPLLPEALRDANPLGLLRRVNGRLSTEPVR